MTPERAAKLTTIAYRAGIVAADSQSVRGDMVNPEPAQKIWRIEHGGLGGIIGTWAVLAEVQAWLSYGKKSWEKPKLPEDTTVVEFLVDGTILEHVAEGLQDAKTSRGFYAWGSGREFAYGALAQGASAFEAVTIAAEFDVWTGGEIRQMRVVSGNEDTEDGA